MWLITTNGFFSAVEDRDDPNIIRVRCRAEGDAEYLTRRLRELGVPGHEVLTDEGSDYRYRVYVDRATFSAFVMDQALDINYGNVKDAVKERQGPERASVYMRVWAALLELQPTGRTYLGADCGDGHGDYLDARYFDVSPGKDRHDLDEEFRKGARRAVAKAKWRARALKKAARA